jgi:NADH-quinone oxidoreductase subunit J
MTAVLFYIFSALLLGAGLFVVLNRNPMYSVVGLVFAFLNLAALYFLLDAYFIGALQVLVYAGAIMVLFLFVVMLLNVKPDRPLKGVIQLNRWWYALMGLMFLGFLLLLVTQAVEILNQPSGVDATSVGSVKEVGTALFTTYLLPFEIASLLLLVALVGTVFLAKRKV